MGTQDDAAAKVVRRFLEAVERHDLEQIGAQLAPDVIQYYQRPTGRSDDGKLNNAYKQGRDAIVEEIRDHFHVTLYQRGTVRLNIERLVSQDGWVAAQFSLAAKTIGTNIDYENFYFFLFEVRDGVIVRYWEYIDTAYANATLYPQSAK
jgi:ketosteroid isomerase-like protein